MASMNSSNPNDKKNFLVGAGYTVKINRKDGGVISATAKKLFGQKPMITTSGIGSSSSSTNVTISTPTVYVKYTRNQSTQTKQSWCNIHNANHPACMSDKKMVEQCQSGIIYPTCNATICPTGNSNMCY